MKPNKKVIPLMIFLMAGCQSASQNVTASAMPSALINARKSLAAGEFSRAKKQTELFLKDNPSSREGQKLMGEILNEEIAQHKEAFEQNPVEEVSQDVKKAEVKTLLERSRSLLDMGEFEEAANTAEEVFKYDGQNREASRLLDQIKQRAWSAGKQEIQNGQEIVKAEVDDRALIYRQQAEDFMNEGQLGAAQMSIQKLLLLYPEDKEGLRILEQIKYQQRRNAASGAKS